MGKKARILMVILLGSVIGLSAQPANLSFKVGSVITGVQMLLTQRSIGNTSITPTLGLAYFSASTKFRDEYDGEVDEGKSAIRIFIPKAGFRRYSGRSENLTSYVALEGWLLLPFISDEDLTTRQKTNTKDALDLLGLTVGYGAEYFFSPQFSLGGEVSMNWIHWDYKPERESASSTYEVRAILGATLSRVTLNYYFR